MVEETKYMVVVNLNSYQNGSWSTVTLDSLEFKSEKEAKEHWEKITRMLKKKRSP